MAAGDDEADPWDVRIAQTGCAAENERLQLCRYDTGDWRQCLAEMQAFRECWRRHNNDRRTATVAAGAGAADSASRDAALAADYNLTGTTHDR